MPTIDPDEAEFQRLYGPWEAWDPAALAGAFAGLDAAWWICGGWAIDAFTGVPREHDDIDLQIFVEDLPRLRHHLAGRVDAWSNVNGSLRPLTDEYPAPDDVWSQVWLREHALAPWRADIILSDRRNGEWVFKRDPTVTMPLEDATWVDDRGIRFQRPEIVLAHKALHGKAKDDRDFTTAWPLLDEPSRAWLRETLERLHPEHHWLNWMAAPAEPVVREGTRVRLREAALDDAAIVDRSAQDRATMMGEFNDFGLPAGKPLAVRLERGRRLVSRRAGTLLVERIDGRAVIGDVSWHVVRYGPNPESEALNIGISLFPKGRGQGYGAEAQRLLAELLFELYDVGRVEASTDVENLAEQKSLERAGFTREGVLRQAQHRAGAYHDLVVYAVTRSDLPLMGDAAAAR